MDHRNWWSSGPPIIFLLIDEDTAHEAYDINRHNILNEVFLLGTCGSLAPIIEAGSNNLIDESDSSHAQSTRLYASEQSHSNFMPPPNQLKG